MKFKTVDPLRKNAPLTLSAVSKTLADESNQRPVSQKKCDPAR
jgi:hypothetical protein